MKGVQWQLPIAQASERQVSTPAATRAPGTSVQTEELDELRAQRDTKLQQLREAEKAYHAIEQQLSDRLEQERRFEYGFISASAGTYMERDSSTSPTPPSIFRLAVSNFRREFAALVRFLKGEPSSVAQIDDASHEETEHLRKQLNKLTLSNEKVWERERARPQVSAPMVTRVPYYILCWALDLMFYNRPIQRFWFLETVARMPYFSYLSMLHLYESLGWWRIGAKMRMVHAFEEWNEFHHLLMVEELGGDRQWSDRFFAFHAAIVYYWVLIALWMLSPAWAYNFSELIESHAVDTYSEFCDENESLLKELPAPRAAQVYYAPSNMYFDEFQSESPKGTRRPSSNTLYDVFCNIRDDEREHVKTMHACQKGIKPLFGPQARLFSYAAAFGSAIATAYVLWQTPN